MPSPGHQPAPNSGGQQLTIPPLVHAYAPVDHVGLL